MFRSIFLATLLVGLSACMKVVPKDDPGSKATTNSDAVSVRPSKITYEFLPADESHEYHIKFMFSQNLSSAYVIKTTDQKKLPEWIVVKDQSWTDLHVDEGVEVTYEFGEWKNNEFVKWDEVRFRSPQDLILDQPVSLTDETFRSLFTEKNGALVLDRYFRIYLGPNAHITTDGRFVKFVTKELVSEGARVETFSQGQTAWVGQVGRSGGKLEIHAEKADGHLIVEMRGENGGQGFVGPLPDESLKGAKGVQGRDATLKHIGDQRGEYLSVALYQCTEQAADGARGSKGYPGYAGGSGLSGGSTGHLLLNIKNKDSLNIQVARFPGVGGDGGYGGEGGEGGEGGDPGKIPQPPPGLTSVSGCTPAGKGYKGEKGVPGPQGPKGANGVSEAVCEVNQKEEKVCY